jgi:outer membrane receptor protein involved in Fe transport
VLYGAGGYGGTFNRITKQPQPKPAASGRLILSDDHSFRTEFDENAGRLPVFGGDKLAFRVNGILERGYTWFGQRKIEDGVAPSLALTPWRNTKIIVQYLYDYRDNQASWETPVHAGDPHGMVTGDGTYHVLPRRIAWIIPDDYRRNTRQVRSVDVRHAFSENLQFRGQFQYETKKQDQVETFPESSGLTILADTALMPRRWRDLPRNTKNFNARDEIVWNVKTGPAQHRVLAGWSWAQQYDDNLDQRSPGNYGGLTGAALTGNGKLTDAQAGPLYNVFPTVTYAQFKANPQLAGFNLNNIMPINLFDRGNEILLAPGVTTRPPLYLNTHTLTYTSNQDYYANDVFSVIQDRVYVMAGARHSRFQRKTIAYASGTFPNKVELASPKTNYQTAEATTSSFGAVWHLNAAKTYSLYANINKSFSPEYRSNPDGSQLDPEEGQQKEVGLRMNFLGGRISGLVDYFDLLQNHVTQADTSPGRTGYFIQVNGQRSSGYELSLNARVTDNWLVFGGYSYTDARNDLTGVKKDLQPKDRFTMFNRYNFTTGRLKSLSLSLGTIYAGERPLTPTTSHGEPNWGPLPSYWRVDAIVGYKLKLPRYQHPLDLVLKVNNVFDNTDIYYVGQFNRYTLDPGREWQAVISTKF